LLSAVSSVIHAKPRDLKVSREKASLTILKKQDPENRAGIRNSHAKLSYPCLVSTFVFFGVYPLYSIFDDDVEEVSDGDME
jgi:hypothetical protein